MTSQVKTPDVLIVEDDAPLSALMSSILTSGGYDVIRANDGADALDSIGRRPALLLLDILMPHMDGTTFLTVVLANNFSGKIVIVSGADNAGELAHFMSADGYLPKPFTHEELLELVQRLIGPPKSPPANSA
jgi:CheY-like chemotaxis protein